METFVSLAIPALVTILTVRMMLLPMKVIYKTAIYAISGFLCLWLLNTVSGFTGIAFPFNGVTVLIAGIGGVPGIAILALLAVL